MRILDPTIVAKIAAPAGRIITVLEIDADTKIYLSNGSPRGADVYVRRWLLAGLPGNESRFDEQKGNLELGQLQFDVDDTDGQATALFASVIGDGNWYKRQVRVYLLNEDTDWSNRIIFGDFSIKEPPNLLNGLFYKIYCLDQNAWLKAAVGDQEENTFVVKTNHKGMAARDTGVMTVKDVMIDDEFHVSTTEDLLTNADLQDWTSHTQPNGWTVAIDGASSRPSEPTLTKLWAEAHRSKYTIEIPAIDTTLIKLEIYTQAYTTTIPDAPTTDYDLGSWELENTIDITSLAQAGYVQFIALVNHGLSEKKAVVARLLDFRARTTDFTNVVASDDVGGGDGTSIFVAYAAGAAAPALPADNAAYPLTGPTWYTSPPANAKWYTQKNCTAADYATTAWSTAVQWQGDPGTDAVTVGMVPSNGVAWSRAKHAGAWTPSGTTSDLVFTFYRAGVSIAVRTVRATLNTSTGAVTFSSVSNSGEATTETFTNNGTTAANVLAKHTASGVSLTQNVTSTQGGDAGADAVTADVDNTNVTEWHIDKTGTWDNTSNTTLTFTFYKAGAAISTSTVLVERVTANGDIKIQWANVSLGTGATIKINGSAWTGTPATKEAKTLNVKITYNSSPDLCVVSEHLSVIWDGYDGAAGPTVTVTIEGTVDNGAVPLNVDFSATVAGTTGALTYTWDFKDAAIAYRGGTNANSVAPQVTFNTAGNYNVKLTLYDAGTGKTVTARFVVNCLKDKTPDVPTIGTLNSYVKNVTGSAAVLATLEVPLTYDQTKTTHLEVEVIEWNTTTGFVSNEEKSVNVTGLAGSKTVKFKKAFEHGNTLYVRAAARNRAINSAWTTVDGTGHWADSPPTVPAGHSIVAGIGTIALPAVALIPSVAIKKTGDYKNKYIVSANAGDSAETSKKQRILKIYSAVGGINIGTYPVGTEPEWTLEDEKPVEVGAKAGKTSFIAVIQKEFKENIAGGFIFVDAYDRQSPAASYNTSGAANIFAVALTGVNDATTDYKINFTATATGGSGSYTSYVWNFGDNTSGSGASVSRTYAGAGSFTVYCTVTDSNGATCTNSIVVIPDKAGIVALSAIINAPTITGNGMTVNFPAPTINGGSGSRTYVWDFHNDGGTDDTNLDPAAFTYTTPGPVVVRLTITDTDTRIAPLTVLYPMTLVSSVTTTLYPDSVSQDMEDPDVTTLLAWYKNSYVATASIPAWVTLTSYIIGDVVADGGAYYCCIVAHTSGAGNRPPGSNWIAITPGGILDETGALNGNATINTNAHLTSDDSSFVGCRGNTQSARTIYLQDFDGAFSSPVVRGIKLRLKVEAQVGLKIYINGASLLDTDGNIIDTTTKLLKLYLPTTTEGWLEIGNEADLWGKPSSFFTDTLLNNQKFGVALNIYIKATTNKWVRFQAAELLVYI